MNADDIARSIAVRNCEAAQSQETQWEAAIRFRADGGPSAQPVLVALTNLPAALLSAICLLSFRQTPQQRRTFVRSASRSRHIAMFDRALDPASDSALHFRTSMILSRRSNHCSGREQAVDTAIVAAKVAHVDHSSRRQAHWTSLSGCSFTHLLNANTQRSYSTSVLGRPTITDNTLGAATVADRPSGDQIAPGQQIRRSTWVIS